MRRTGPIDLTARPTRGGSGFIPFLVGVISTCVLVILSGLVQAADFVETFDGPEHSWKIQADGAACRIVEQQRHSKIRREGTAAEQIILDCQRTSQVVLSHRVSPARALDELTASVWIRSNRGGVTLALRLVYPHLIDPDTGTRVTRLIEGSTYQSDGTWQCLNCRTLDKELQRRSRLLRARFGATADLRDVHVDEAYLVVDAAPGTTEMIIDELRLGPIVSPARELVLPTQTGRTEESQLSVELRLDRLSIQGQPFVPRIWPYHGESVEDLADLQMSPVWLPDSNDTQLIRHLGNHGIHVMAPPPIAVDTNGAILDAETAGLPPLGVETDGVLFWMLGNQISPEERRRVANWRQQILAVDQRRPRPLIADVTGDERAFARLVPMLGSSRQVHHTSLDYESYRSWLSDRQQLARPGGFQWTWIHTGPDETQARHADRQRWQVPVVEPEQIRLQMYAALSAGCRGLGYWSTHQLSTEIPEHQELAWQLKELNLELQLLEPWLATGSVVGQAQVITAPPETKQNSSPRPGVRVQPVGNGSNTRKLPNIEVQIAHAPDNSPELPLAATLIESDYGLLVLGMCFEPSAQFVPGPEATHTAALLVPGVKETSRAWQVTTTEIIPLQTDRNARPGGTLIKVPRWEMTLAVVISSDLTIRHALREKMLQIQAASSQCWVELAHAKWIRVQQTDAQLRQLGRGQPDADRLLQKSQAYWQSAASRWEAKAYHAAREDAEAALQLLRILQRAHWETAVAELHHPLATEHTTCFASLPDYWRLRDTLQHSGVNALVSGSFDDEDTFRTAGWQHRQNELPHVLAAADLVNHPSRPGYCLRLQAGPAAGEPAPVLIPQPLVTVSTPNVPVTAGQLVHVRAQIQIVHPITCTHEGFEIRDSAGGEHFALRFREMSNWQTVDIWREVRESGPFHLDFLLHGLGEVLIDELVIETLPQPVQ